MGRPKLGVPVLVRLPAELIVRLDAQATEQGITRPELIRRALSREAYNCASYTGSLKPTSTCPHGMWTRCETCGLPRDEHR